MAIFQSIDKDFLREQKKENEEKKYAGRVRQKMKSIEKWLIE